LGAFYYGYAVSQPFGGILAERYGGKWILGLSIACSSLLSMALPPIAYMGKVAFITTRVLQGVVEGMVYPAYFAMASKWLPAPEKAFLTSLIMFGEMVACLGPV
jgi:MFS family permease